jgi:hypothetical protein
MEPSTGTAPRNASLRGVAAVLLALVVGGTAVTWFTATSNFRVVDPRRDPRIDRVFAPLEGDEARTQAVRYVASQSNRAMFRFFAVFESAATALAFATYLVARARFPSSRDRFATALFLLVLALVATVALLVPEIVNSGREIDFLPRSGGLPAPVERFRRLHAVFLAADVLKVLASGTLIALLLGALPDRDPARS